MTYSDMDVVEKAAERLAREMLVDISKLYGSQQTVTAVREAAEMDGDSSDAFDGWLPLRLASANKYYDYTLQELRLVRDAVRTMCDTNEVAKNILLHYRNFVVGKGVRIGIYPEDLGDDPVKLAALREDAQVRKMKSNWKAFTQANKFTLRLHDWIKRAHRDGEMYMRIFDTAGGVPTVRFIDPSYIDSTDSDTPFGVVTATADAETVTGIIYRNPITGDETTISSDDLIIDVRNVDMGAPRGIPSYWPCMSNFRRLEKILVNSSVLATVQAAITMVRKHDSATGAKVEALIKRTSDGVSRTDSNGRSIYARKVRPGTVLDAPKGITYEFPSHNVNASSFIDIAKHELAHIANGFVLPVDWLLTTEPVDPLTPGSPVVANFESEQVILYTGIEDLFWKVQDRMGINAERNRVKYALTFNGKRLAVGKALDEARVDEILLRNGATSPQEIASKHGYQYPISRANVIKHRATQQSGEAMPGDSGNTSPATQPANGGDGTTTKNMGQRLNDGDGGNNV